MFMHLKELAKKMYSTILFTHENMYKVRAQKASSFPSDSICC